MPQKIIKLFCKIVKIISFKRVLIWTITGIVGVIGFTVFENSKIIYSTLSNDYTKLGEVGIFKISEVSKIRLKKFVDNNDIISSIIILNVNIRHNQQVPVFWYAADPTILRALNMQYNDRGVSLPVFSSNEQNNAEIVSMINGEFMCNGNSEVINIIDTIDVKNKFLYFCSISLPPYYGHFSGYIIITLKSIILDKAIIDSIKMQMTSVATAVYLRDIQPFSKFKGNQ